MSTKRSTDKTWIQSRSGKKIDLLNFTKDMVNFHDIVHAQFNLCRFTGHTSHIYSVGDHTALCGELYTHVFHNPSPQGMLAMLLHDAAEAYIGDVSTPLRNCLGDELQTIEDNILRTIFDVAGIPDRFPLEMDVKEIDKLALIWEYNRFFAYKGDLDWGLRSNLPQETLTQAERSAYLIWDVVGYTTSIDLLRKIKFYLAAVKKEK